MPQAPPFGWIPNRESSLEIRRAPRFAPVSGSFLGGPTDYPRKLFNFVVNLAPDFLWYIAGPYWNRLPRQSDHAQDVKTPKLDSHRDGVLADWRTPAQSLETDEARALLEKVLRRLQAICSIRGRAALLDRLVECWLSGRDGHKYSQLAREFELSEDVVKATGHRVRLRLVVLLRVELAQDRSTKGHVEKGLQQLRRSLESVG